MAKMDILAQLTGDGGENGGKVYFMHSWMQGPVLFCFFNQDVVT